MYFNGNLNFSALHYLEDGTDKQFITLELREFLSKQKQYPIEN
jgi:hypothetical protein